MSKIFCSGGLIRYHDVSRLRCGLEVDGSVRLVVCYGVPAQWFGKINRAITE